MLLRNVHCERKVNVIIERWQYIESLSLLVTY
jgi:hypothetical protein